MNTKSLFDAAYSAVIERAAELVTANRFKEVLFITPEILKRLSFHLPKEVHTICIFKNFDKQNPLSIPKGTVFVHEVYIDQCCISNIENITCHEGLILNDISFIGMRAFPEKAERIILSTMAFQDYQRFRRLYRLPNRTVKVIEDSYCLSRLNCMQNQVAEISLLSYLQSATVNYTVKDDITYVHDDIVLRGPYRVNLSGPIVFEKDLTIIDDTGYVIPDTVKLLGRLNIF